jgi:putative inorganic carbon (HCO3(-)) transporter
MQKSQLALYTYRWPLALIGLLSIQVLPIWAKVFGVALLAWLLWHDWHIGVVLVPMTAPLYLIPVAITAQAAVPLHEIVLLLTVAGAGLSWLRQRQWPWVWHPFDLWVVLLLGSATMSLFWVLPEGRSEALRVWRWLIVEPIIWFLLVRHARAQGLTIQLLQQGLVITGAIVAGLGILQFVGVDLVPWLGSKRAFSDNVVATGNIRRVASVYGHANNVGLFLERVWPFALVGVLGMRPQLNWRWAGIGMIALGIVFSFSRGAWMSIALATFLLAIWHVQQQRSLPIVRIVIGMLVIGVVIVLGTLLARGGSIGSIDARWLLWQESVTWLMQRPWGLGLGQFYFYHNPEYGRSIMDVSLIGTSEQYASHPHNVVLDTWLNLGPVGLIALVGMLVHLVRRSVLYSGVNRVMRAAGVMLVAAFVHGMVDQFWFVADLMYCFWLAAAMILYDGVDTSDTARL